MAEVVTKLGAIRGRERNGIQQFLGIPYAAPPTGSARFRAPAPPTPWGGTRDATALGASAPQPPPIEGNPLPRREVRWDEDCLFLNVYTPAADARRRPVLVWIHGGAYVQGSGDLYDGTSFAERGDIVVVTVNYRLGAFGFMELGHLDPALTGSQNNGIRDQIASLRWVRDHIACFGGDPDCVTVSGESAGAGSVMALLAAPEADDLFHRAIAQSAPAGFGALEPGAAERYLEALGGDGIDTLRTATADEILDAQKKLAAASQARTGISLFGNGGPGHRPVIDGHTVTRSAVEAVEIAGENGRPILIGTNLDEGTLFSFHLPKDVTDQQMRAAVAAHTDEPDAVLAAFAEAHPDASNRRRMVHMNGDTMFRTPSLRVVDAQVDSGGPPVFVYLFTWKSQGFGGAMGAMHALEIPFVWNMDRKPWAALLGEGDPAPPDLADRMHEAWIAFTRTGDPNHDGLPAWPAYDTQRRPTMEFGDTIGIVDDPGGDTRASWG